MDSVMMHCSWFSLDQVVQPSIINAAKTASETMKMVMPKKSLLTAGWILRPRKIVTSDVSPSRTVRPNPPNSIAAVWSG